MGIYAIKPAFQRRLVALRDWCIRAGLSADFLTALAVVTSVAGGAALALSEKYLWLLLTVPILAMGRITLNALDGMVATATRTSRPFGEVFNEFADRLSDTAWFGGVAFIADVRLALGTLVIVLMSSYVGTVAKAAGGPRIYSGVMAKADRMIVFSIFSIAVFLSGRPSLFQVMLALVGAGSLVTLVQRLVIARRVLEHRRADDAS